jgi:beta-ribofuranosylaminobenzene 5'-phosphate synthase
VGVMLAEPSVALRLHVPPGESLQADHVTGEAATVQRVREFVDCYRQTCEPEHRPPFCRIAIVSSLPEHHGLGSGTQLGLAVARGLAELAGEAEVASPELARRVGRGRRSAVGVHGFAAGGLIVDAGKSANDRIGDLACRLPLPDEWRVLLATPRGNTSGLSGETEERLFDRLGSMPDSVTERLCRIVLTALLPAAVNAALDEFAIAVAEYGRVVGEFFAPVQGGTFANPWTESTIGRLNELGVVGAGQSSWGPAVFAFLPEETSVSSLRAAVGDSAQLRITNVRNSGAAVER